MGSAQAKRSKARPDGAFERALTRLRRSEDREAALIEFLDQVLPDMERLRAVSQEMVMLGKIGLASEQSTEYLAGRPAQVIAIEELRERSAKLLAEQSVAAKARQRLLSQPMLTGSAVSELLGSQSRNRRQYANELRKRGTLLALPDRNRYLYPTFQFDIDHRRIRPVVAEVNRLLGAAEDPWGVASWWMLPSGALEGGRSPADLLECPGKEEVVVRLARIEREPIG